MFKTFALLVGWITISQFIYALEPAKLAVAAERPRIGIDPQADYVIPIVRDAGGYTTSFFLSNRDSKTLHLAVYFAAADGSPLTLPIQDLGSVTAVPVDLEVNQSATFQTTGDSVTAVDGYAMVFSFDRPASDPDAKISAGLFSGQATFMENMNGVAVETLVPISSAVETTSAIAFDNSSGYSTTIVLVNSGAYDVTDATLTIRDRSGTILQKDDIMLAPGARQCIPLATQYPITAGQTGRVFISGSGPYLTPIALRVNATGGFTTLLPWSIDNRLMP